MHGLGLEPVSPGRLAGARPHRTCREATPKNRQPTFHSFSDSPIGFNRPVNADITGTIKAPIHKITGVAGRAAGTIKTFQYSEAVKNVKRAWDDDTLDKWPTVTESIVPDNDMSFRVPK
jgi:hypothetical protein